MKVVVLYNQLFHYRIPVWNILAEKCDLTVAYSEGNGNLPEGMEIKFKVLHLPYKRYLGRFVIQKDSIGRLIKQYDAALVYGDISWLKYITIPWFHKIPVVFHTIGVSASYDKKYDAHKEWDYIRYLFFRKADALAFYTEYPIEKYAKFGMKREKMFVAHNTVAVSPVKEKIEKNSILVIGTLYKEKGIQLLLDAYLKLKDKCKLPVLNIIGKGPDYDYINQWILDNKMQDVIFLRGAIYDISQKAKYFAKAFACISPKQAGLTVLESMGYGVPFVTTKNAITGGEIFNVHNGRDGVIMDNESELVNVVYDIAVNPEKYITLGEKAQQYYDNNRTPAHMAQGLWDAICFSSNLISGSY